MDILNLQNQFKKRKLSPVELTQDMIALAKQNTHNAYITVVEDQAMLQAQAAEKIIMNNEQKALTGIPFSLKDLFITKNIRTTAGSKMLYNYIPPYEGYVSSALNKEGAVLIGKVGCDEFGMGSTNEFSAFGPVKNPLSLDHVAGGSSGGSAASVAEGSSVFSIGTDTGGSVRQPANFCGLYGFKPTYGRVSRYGQIAYASSLDQAAPMAKSTIDLSIIMEALTQKDDRDTTNVPNKRIQNLTTELVNLKMEYLKGKKIAYAPDLINGCSPEVKETLNKEIVLLEKAGCELMEVDLPHLKYAVSVYYIIATSEASANLARYDGIHFGYSAKNAQNLAEAYMKSRSQGLGGEVQKRIILGTFSLSSGYQDEYFAKACKVRRLIAQDFDSIFARADAFLSPVCGSTAFKSGLEQSDSFKMYMNDLYTLPVNLAGLPALAIPCKTSGPLPSGYQLVGNNFNDEELLRLGRAIELFKKD